MSGLGEPWSLFPGTGASGLGIDLVGEDGVTQGPVETVTKLLTAFGQGETRRVLLRVESGEFEVSGSR